MVFSVGIVDPGRGYCPPYPPFCALNPRGGILDASPKPHSERCHVKSHRVRFLSGVALFAGVATLPACVQPRVSELSRQLEDTQRFAAQMEQTYAAQEAEILALRQEVASLRSQNQAE